MKSYTEEVLDWMPQGDPVLEAAGVLEGLLMTAEGMDALLVLCEYIKEIHEG